jgi:hypothetical protein
MFMNNARPDHLSELRELRGQIRKLDPKATFTSTENIPDLLWARERLAELTRVERPPLTKAQTEYQDVHKLRNQLATKLEDFVRRGLADYSWPSMKFPSEDLSTADQLAGLNAIASKLDGIWQEHSLSPDAKAKRAMNTANEALARVATLEQRLTIAIARIHSLEQEASHV